MKPYYILFTLAAGLVLSSCSLFGSLTKKGDTKDTHQSSYVTGPVKPNKNKKDKHNQSQTAEASALGKLPSQDELLGAQWTISAVGENMIQAEDNAPYIVFDAEGRFYAGDGCNVLNGDYVLRSNGTMAFNSVLSTMRLCPDAPFASEITAALSDGKEYTVDCKKIGQDTYLYLKDGKGRSAVTLRRHNMEFLNGNWSITSAEGKSVDDEEANLFIDIPELKVHGNTGCNFFNGDLYIDPSRSNAIDFSNMALTRMACPKADQERRIMVALEQAVSAIAGKNDDTVLLIDGNGKELMTLKRIPVENYNE